MKKVTDLYPPEIARHKLEKHFNGNDTILGVVQKMNKSDLCAFAALCDGNVMTTSGYNIIADVCINRASAVVHSLKRKFLPVSTRAVSIESDVGGAVKQAAFVIEQSDLDRLKAEPDVVMKECERNINGQKRSNAQKDMSRLYREFGETGVLELLQNVASANDGHPPEDQAS